MRDTSRAQFEEISNGLDTPALTPVQATYFREQFRKARAKVLLDAEEWLAVVLVLEQLVAVIAPGAALHDAAEPVARVASRSALAEKIPSVFRHCHTPFLELYRLVRRERNAALHQGAFARHLAIHAIELSLVLEDALEAGSMLVSDYMVREPVCAEWWQPLSFVRQAMLLNSFSYLPVRPADGTQEWALLSDLSLAVYLRSGGVQPDGARLKATLAKAVESGELVLDPARTILPTTPLTEAFSHKTGDRPALIVTVDGSLIGILTPFDLL